MKPLRNSFTVVLAKLGDEAATTGAAAWAEHTVTQQAA
jgi:hypothetical protein